MRLACISDTHGAHDLLRHKPQADVLIYAGDMGGWGKMKEVVSCINWIRDLPYKHKIVIPGNHDWALYSNLHLGQELLGKEGHFLIDEGVDIKGHIFYGSPWTTMFCNWAFMKDEDGLEKKWANIPSDTEVLITHGPPYGILDKTVRDDRAGSVSLLEFFVKREHKIHTHIFGHIHEARGFWATSYGTKFYNVSLSEEVPQFTIIDI
jgi:Icc-related predicted phosphoesterase